MLAFRLPLFRHNFGMIEAACGKVFLGNVVSLGE